jgi:hypothetical protein
MLWAGGLVSRGYVPDNLPQFRHACQRAKDMVERRDWRKLSKKARISAQQNEPW